MKFEGEHTVIPLRGIERAGADSVIKDGAMNEVIGLDVRDGSYVPYEPAENNVSFPKNTIVIRRHHTSTGDNIIAITNDLSLFFRRYNSTAWEYVCELPSKEIVFLGNAICTTQSGIYILWQNTNYVVKSNQIYPHLQIRVQESQEFSSTDQDIAVAGNEQVNYNILKTKANDAGLLHQMHLCCYAVMLTNGSYAYISNPFLIQHPRAEINEKVCKYKQDGSPFFYGSDQGSSTKYRPYYLITQKLQYKLNTSYKYDEVLRISIFLSPGVNLYDVNNTTLCYNKYVPNYSMGMETQVSSELLKNDMFYRVYDIYSDKLIESDNWEEISLSGKLGDNMYVQELLPVYNSYTYKAEQLFVYNSRLHMINNTRKKRNEYELNDFIYNPSSSTNDYDNVQEKGTLSSINKNIILIKFESGKTYNEYDIRNGTVNLYVEIYYQGKIEFHLLNGGIYDITLPKYGESGYRKRSLLEIMNTVFNDNINTYKITIFYKTTIGEELITVNNGIYTYVDLLKLNPVLSVNSNDAYRIVLEVSFNNNIYIVDKNLQKGEHQNTAYYIDTNFYPIIWTKSERNTFMTNEENSSSEIIHMIVSEVNAPNVFNFETYTIGKERKIVGVTFYSLQITSENFGKFPLVVFTNDGVYVMTIEESGQYAYNAINKISEDICLSRNLICRTNKGVLFGTERGLMLFDNNGISEIFHHIIGIPHHLPYNDKTYGNGLLVYYNAITYENNNGNLTNLLMTISREDILALFNENTNIEYDMQFGNVILWNDRINYVYVLNINNWTIIKSITSSMKPILMSDKEGRYYGK